ncbi:carboxylating nicotinate-nucleotide diphosphorylase [Azonexus sp.]|uniref:carboxylating nicotinate-nucleotide diphosphorylase n=1 Tax=Azonexus sp. TaxID=1872668 RepID=UPI0039E59B69
MAIDFDYPLAEEIARNVDAALIEDVGAGDLTAALVPAGCVARATVVAREAGVLCGRDWFDACVQRLDAHATVDWSAADGTRIAAGQVLCSLTGDARALLTAERSALNFLQLLSAVASKTRIYADALSGTRAQVVDTRKTLPGLRIAQKYAVRAGGGGNHRLALWDAILIKENHIHAAGGIAAAVAAARSVAGAAGGRCKFIQVEVENLAELEEALAADVRMVLLDNFTLENLRAAVTLNAGRSVLEASGNVTLETLPAIAQTGVDRISVGALTKDVKALDLSMRFVA